MRWGSDVVRLLDPRSGPKGAKCYYWWPKGGAKHWFRGKDGAPVGLAEALVSAASMYDGVWFN